MREQSVLLPLDDPGISSIEQDLIKDAVERVPHAHARWIKNMPSSALVGQDTPLEVT